MKENNQKKFRGDIVKKDNVLNEGIYTLDTAEKYKLMLLMISQISTKDKIPETPEEIANKTYSFYIDDYAELKAAKNKYWFEDYVSDMVQYLKQNTAITIKSENSIRTIWIFQEVDFKKDKKGWKVIFRFSHSIAEYLFELKEKFIAYHIKNIMPMRSKYSIRLYELLKQYEKIGERTFEIDEFREKMGTRVYVIDPKTQEKKILQDDYKDFLDLRRRVIEKAVKEVNEFSDIEITDVEYARKGRKIWFITFYFKPKINFNLQKIEEIKEKVETDKNEVLKKSKEIPIGMEITWRNIGELRKHYQKYIKEIKMWESSQINRKLNKLSENEILFLLINADKDLFDEDIITSIIKKAMVNKDLKNPLGFLIKTLGIDMKTAKFTELTMTAKKIDEEIFKKKLEEMLIEGKSAIEYIKPYWNAFIKPAYEEGKLSKETLQLLKEPFKLAVYDELENKIYIPAPDEFYKIWFEGNFIKSLKVFLQEKFGIEDVVIEVVDVDEAKRNNKI